MTATSFIQAAERWHCRVLGILWALCGLACAGEFLRRTAWWEDTISWLGIMLGFLLVAAGSGLAFRRVWARWCMFPLLAVSALVCADGVLCGGWCGNHLLLHWSLVGLGVAGYTASFIAVSFWMIYRD